MAKAKPSLTLVEMESQLGYKVDSLTYPDESSERFYSDLRPIPNSTYGKTREEFEEYERKMYRIDERTISEKVLPELDVVKVSRPRPEIRQADTVIDDCTWRGHSNSRAQEPCCLLQFYCEYSLRVRIRLATAIQQR